MRRRNSSVADPISPSYPALDLPPIPPVSEIRDEQQAQLPSASHTASPYHASNASLSAHDNSAPSFIATSSASHLSSPTQQERRSSLVTNHADQYEQDHSNASNPLSLAAHDDEKSSKGSMGAPREIIARLREFNLFAPAPESFLEAIAGKLVMQVQPANSFIITEGEEARAMYWIIRGSVAIVSRDGEAVHAELGPGAFFGEIGILFDCPRTASVQAREKCILAVLTAGALNEVSPAYPVIEQAIRDEAQERLALLDKNRIANLANLQESSERRQSVVTNSSEVAKLKVSKNSKEAAKSRPRHQSIGDLSKYLEHTGVREIIAEMPLFNSLPSAAVHKLALAVVPKTYGPFEMIFRQNTRGKDIYFIIEGQVEILDEDSQTPIARLARGAYFGEMAFLALDEKRTASVRTITVVDCLVVTGETLDALCEDFPEVQTNIEATAKLRTGKNHSQNLGHPGHSNSNVGPSSIYLSKRHSISSSSSEHSMSTRDEESNAGAPQGKPLDLDPFNIRKNVEDDEQEDEHGVGLFSKSWNTAGSFGSAPVLLKPPARDVAPHEFDDLPSPSRTDRSSLDLGGYNLTTMTASENSLPTSPHQSEPPIPDPAPSFAQFKFGPTNDTPFSNSPSASPSPSPVSSRQSSRSLIYSGFVDSIPEEDETGEGITPIYQSNSSTIGILRRASVGLVLHPRAKRARQSGRRRSSLFNVGPFPDFIQIKIFQFLDLKTLMVMQRVCHHWQQILQTSQALLRELDLSIYSTTITDTTIIPITNFVGIRPKIVNISNCFHLTDEGFSLLVNAIGLAQIHVFKMKSVWEVSGMAIMDLTVPSIGANLEEIDLSNCRKVNDTTLSRLIGWVVPEHGDNGGAAPGTVIGCPNLRRISLSYCKHITDRSMYHMAMFASDRIEAIDLTRCTSITDHGFSFWTLRSFSALRSLNLADCTFLTDKAIIAIATSAKGLQKLVLSFCCSLTDVAVDVLSLGCPALSTLDLAYCGSAVSDASLARVALHLHELQTLSVRGCVRVTRAGVDNILMISGAHRLRNLDISQCRNVMGPVQSPIDASTGLPRVNIRC